MTRKERDWRLGNARWKLKRIDFIVRNQEQELVESGLLVDYLLESIRLQVVIEELEHIVPDDE